MPAPTPKTRRTSKPATFVFEGIEIPIWPVRAKGQIPLRLIKKAVRAGREWEKARQSKD